MANRYWVGGTATWDTTAGSKWATTSGGTGGQAVPTTSDNVFFDLNSGLNTVTIGTGAVCSILTMTGFTGTLAFGSNSISAATSSAATTFTGDTTYSVSGTPLIKLTNTGSTTKTIIAGNVSEAQSISFEITAGTGTVSFSGNIRSLIFSGSTSTLSGTNAFTLYGDLTFISGITIAVGISVRTFAGSGTQKITVPSPLNLNFPITFSGTGTYQLQGNVAVGTSSSRTITHTSGTIDLQSYTLEHYGTYTSGGLTNTRGFAGTGVYNIIRTGTATYWDCANATGFTRSGTASVQFTGVNTSAVTLTVLHGTTTGAEANAMSFFFGSAPTVVLNGTNPSWIADLGVLPSSSITLSGTLGRTIYGGFFGGSTTTQSSNPFGALIFASTSATARNINITSSSYALTFNGVGGSWQLSGTSSAPTVTLTNGTFSTNGNSLTVTTFDFTTTGTRTLNINTTLTIGSSGIFKGISTGTTLNNTGTISGSSYTVDVPNLNIGNVTTTSYITIGASASSYTIINNLSVSSGGGKLVTLFAGSTLNIAGSLSIDGASGSTNILNSNTSGTRATISKSSGTIITNNLNIIDSNATGGATWKAPTNYGNIDGGNNLNWDFSAISAGGGGNFLMFF